MTRWATKKEAAEHLRVSDRVIQDAVNDGELQAYPVGKGNRDYRLDLDEVDVWMKSRSHVPRRSA